MYFYDKREAAVLLVLDDTELQTQFFDKVTRRLAMGRKLSSAGERENAGNYGMLIVFSSNYSMFIHVHTFSVRRFFIRS